MLYLFVDHDHQQTFWSPSCARGYAAGIWGRLEDFEVLEINIPLQPILEYLEFKP